MDTAIRTNLLSKILKHASTGADGDSFDIARICAIFIIPLYMFMGWVELNATPEDRAFDFQGFGTGFGIILAGLGAFIFLKKDTEPKATPGGST